GTDLCLLVGWPTRPRAPLTSTRFPYTTLFRSKREPDLILLDIWMPDIDGISLLEFWHENNELHCPVIMMSGHGTLEHAIEATKLDRKSTRLNSSHVSISYAVFCLKKKTPITQP